MYVVQKEAASEVKQALKRILADNDLCEKITDYAQEEFNLPSGRLADYYTERLNVTEAKPEIFWYLVNIADRIEKKNGSFVASIYTPQEIEAYKGMRFSILKAKFPIRIPCLQVADDQWIGASDTHFLMELRASQLINYNANAQRIMKQRIVHGNVTYQISVNKASVAQIRKLMEDGTYISNTITLNIPQDEYEFSYDDKAKELVIRNLDHFDITDGYHRYLAMAQIYDINENFNYPMEIRIVHFSDVKARQMIWQEDQKTKMTKIESRSLNPNLACNRIVEAMNADPTFYWNGLISNKQGAVNFAELAEVVRWFYYLPAKITSRKDETKFIIRLPKEIDPKINLAIDADDRLMEKADFRDLMIIFYCITTFDGNEITEKAKKGLANKDKLSVRFRTKRARKGLVTEIAAIINEGS